MKFATINDLDKIKKIFLKYDNIFPYIKRYYAAKLEDPIKRNQVIFQDNVVIIYRIYKVNTRFHGVKRHCGDCHISEIVTKMPGDGNAGRVLKKFLIIYRDKVIWTEAMAKNKRSIRFFEKFGFNLTGQKVVWGKKTKGVILIKKPDRSLI